MLGGDRSEPDVGPRREFVGRTGLLVRTRARMGLLPGDVSTAALSAARRVRRVGTLVAILAAFFAVAIPLLELTSEPRQDSASVVAVLGPDEVPGRQYLVVLASGATVALEADPELLPGEEVTIRGSSNAPDGLVVDGEFVPTPTYSEPDYTMPLVFGIVFGIVLLAWLVPTIGWSWRSFGQIRDDLDVPTEVAEGIYIGSWRWRGLINRGGRGAGLSPFGGIPIAIEHGSDGPAWYGAPTSCLQGLIAFERHLRDHGRAVIVTFHPSTKVVAAIRSVHGQDLQITPPVDPHDSEIGLPLRFPRWKPRPEVASG